MSLYNDDVNLNDIGDDDVVTETPQNEITDESTNPPIVIDNPIEYDEIDFDDDNFQGGGGESIPVIIPPTELDPVGYANMVSKTFSTRLVITDYSQSFLEDLYNQGAEFHAVYLDGYDEVISWQEIVDPYTSTTETASSEILSLTEAIGQHFWIGDDGIHVTEAEEKDYLANHYGHSMLINSYGLLMRNSEYNLVGITQSAITFYDGTGNESTDITALFGPTTIIGRENKAHVQINYQGFEVYNKNEESIATIKTLNDENGNLTDTVLCHLVLKNATDGTSKKYIWIGLSKTGYIVNSIISIRANNEQKDIIWNETIPVQDSAGNDISDIAIPNTDGYADLYNALYPYVDSDVLVTIYTTRLYNTYALGIRNPDYVPGLNAFVVGENNTARGISSVAYGNNAESYGAYSHAEGVDTYAAATGSHAEGYQTITQEKYYALSGYNHAEGYQTKAIDLAAHAEGANTKAIIPYGHAEGLETTVSNGTLFEVLASHAEGRNTETRCSYSHAAGWDTLVDSNSIAAYAGGKGTIAKSLYCTVLGAYNNYSFDTDDGISYLGQMPTGNKRARLFVVGCGSSDQYRHNALTVDTDRTWINKLVCNDFVTCPYKVGDVYFTTTNYGTTGPSWMTSYNDDTGQYTYATWTKLTFTAISGVYAYKRVS